MVIKRILHRKESRFIFVGALNTILGLAMYPFLYFILGGRELGYIHILLLTQILCVSFSFLTQKYFVFKTQGNYLNEIIKFIAFHGVYLAANLITLPLMVEGLEMNPVVAQTLIALALITSSYFWHNGVTFSSQKVR